MSATAEEREGRRLGSVVAITLWLIAVFGIILGLQSWFPSLASRHGAGIDLMLIFLLIATGFLFVAGHIILGYFVWRFSGQTKVTHRRASRKTERNWSILVAVLMTLVAEGGVLVLGIPVWGEFYAAEAPADSVALEVTGEQFAWHVRYPGRDGLMGRIRPELISQDNPVGVDANDPAALDDITTVGLIYLPVNRPARIRLRSKDVLHSFFLPNLRVKQDAVPGMAIDVWFVPTQPGSYEVACTELCGFGHYSMRAVLRVVSEEEFRRWLDEQLPLLEDDIG